MDEDAQLNLKKYGCGGMPHRHEPGRANAPALKSNQTVVTPSQDRQQLSDLSPVYSKRITNKVPDRNTDLVEDIHANIPEHFDYIPDSQEGVFKEVCDEGAPNAKRSVAEKKKITAGLKRTRPLAAGTRDGDTVCHPQKRAKQALPSDAGDTWPDISTMWLKCMWQDFDGSLIAFFEKMNSVSRMMQETDQQLDATDLRFWQEKRAAKQDFRVKNIAAQQAMRHTEAMFASRIRNASNVPM
jgi:hypothetical protein